MYKNLTKVKFRRHTSKKCHKKKEGVKLPPP